MKFLKQLIHPELDLSEWLNNILFGLIMVLTTTAVLGMQTPPKPTSADTADEIDDEGDTPQSILRQIIGCNVAWGIINGGLLVLDRLYERGKADRFSLSIRNAVNDEEALAIIEEENEWDLDDVSPDVRRQLFLDVLQRAKAAAPPLKMRILSQDVADAIVTCLVVAVTVLPVVVAELSLQKPALGFRVGNGISLAIMFTVGYFWARETDVNRWITGFLITAFGVAAVAVAWSMGG